MEHHVVALQTAYCAIPSFDFPYTLTEYNETTAGELLERIKDATIVVTCILAIPTDVAKQCKKLQAVFVYATGCGWLDRDGMRKLGVTVCNCPQTNITAVSEHALGLYFAGRKRIVEMHNRTTNTDDWVTLGTLTKLFPGPPPSLGQETVAIVGYGFLGKAIERLLRALGVEDIRVAERRGAPAVRQGRHDFDHLLKEASVFFICCPKDADTTNLISKPQLELMRKDAFIINMARGGIVNEADVVSALRQRTITSYATDVLEVEPPIRGVSPLLPLDPSDSIPGLTISPHSSWYAQQTIVNLQRILREGVEAFVKGEPINIVLDGRSAVSGAMA